MAKHLIFDPLKASGSWGRRNSSTISKRSNGISRVYWVFFPVIHLNKACFPLIMEFQLLRMGAWGCSSFYYSRLYTTIYKILRQHASAFGQLLDNKIWASGSSWTESQFLKTHFQWAVVVNMSGSKGRGEWDTSPGTEGQEPILWVVNLWSASKNWG